MIVGAFFGFVVHRYACYIYSGSKGILVVDGLQLLGYQSKVGGRIHIHISLHNHMMHTVD